MISPQKHEEKSRKKKDGGDLRPGVGRGVNEQYDEE